MTDSTNRKSFWKIYTPGNIYRESVYRLRSLSRRFRLLISQRAQKTAAYDDTHATSVGNFYDANHDKFMRVYGPVIQAFRTKNADDLLNYEMLSMGLRRGQRVLDAGCGVGIPALYFARHAGVTVDALTISQKQFEAAVTNIAAQDMGNQVSVTRGDYHRLTDYFEPASYDVIYFLESLGHSRDKEHLLKVCWETLKPGGLLYIKDLFQRVPVLPEHKKKLLPKLSK